MPDWPTSLQSCGISGLWHSTKSIKQAYNSICDISHLTTPSAKNDVTFADGIWLNLSAFEPVVGEPLAYGEVVESQAGIGHSNGKNKAADSDHNVGVCRGLGV